MFTSPRTFEGICLEWERSRGAEWLRGATPRPLSHSPTWLNLSGVGLFVSLVTLPQLLCQWKQGTSSRSPAFQPQDTSQSPLEARPAGHSPPGQASAGEGATVVHGQSGL